ncbi:hypothetical protein IRJ41_001318 [Triplophysa rosa]|uniref:CUB domain-containing protein n=1 Tax=Triplophysa rosa TaxID=992332 RepID=A0A9W8C828_TRIRA|nr:hypothetical protein IRJ41_001318 [Triplophysa rosa]
MQCCFKSLKAFSFFFKVLVVEDSKIWLAPKVFCHQQTILDSYGASCQWNIRVPTGKNVHLHFSNFSLEKTTLCLNDKVTLSDNIGSVTHCSTSPPRDLVTAGDILSVSFSSNDKVVDLGFGAHWKAVDPADIEINKTIFFIVLIVSPAAVGCGGHFTSEQGELQSIPSARRIYVVFTHFELQAVNLLGKCVDYVEIFNSNKFCGFVQPSLSLPYNKITIRFLSNAAGQEKGFRGYWTTDPSVFPTLPPPLPNPWDDILISEYFNVLLFIIIIRAFHSALNTMQNIECYCGEKLDDIALVRVVRLTKAITVTPENSQVCLPKPESIMPAGHVCYNHLSGGFIHCCHYISAYFWGILGPLMSGDSGGPFVCKQTGTGASWEVHGVVSFRPRGCIVDKKPSVSAFSHWIEDNIKRYTYENMSR